jgi:predicted AAA+ superfamily ATPase
LPQLGFRFPALTMRRFWTMLAHYHGQIWNGSELGASLGVSHHATRRYLDALAGAYVVRQLQPWFINVGKRVVKSPKVYIRDSGLFHTLLGIPELAALQSHPKLGASWEGFVLEQILDWAGERNAYFWATHNQAELDLLLIRHGKNWGIEFKYQDAPTMTKSMHIALQDLTLERLWVVYPGPESYPLHEKVECISLRDLARVREIIE